MGRFGFVGVTVIPIIQIILEIYVSIFPSCIYNLAKPCANITRGWEETQSRQLRESI